MKLYADTPVRAVLQLVSDLFALVWVCAWVYAALTLREAVLTLNRPGELMASTGAGFTEHMGTAAENVRQVPFAGDALATPFDNLSDTGATMSQAGESFQETVGTLAVTLPLLVVAIPLYLVAATWLPMRVRWIRRATGTRRLDRLAPDAQARLLALRALSSASTSRLLEVHADPAGAWRANDPATVAGLADLELRRLGLRPRPARSAT
ncbi:hypothetical protein ABZ635_08310 [Nocardiopsis sp. NPDC007018]|uniref:hypothetical protein n=1 Tax=Nocardiopsis sp. NPDC007018 TaxID=3155721 RepID=UPI0033EA0921